MDGLPFRYSPSGAVLATFNTGARLRLAEATTTMGGTVAIPFPGQVIAAGGFGSNPPLRVALPKPKAALRYRARLALDINNVSTSSQGGVVLYLDTSVDGGTVWSTPAKNAHYINASLAASHIEGRSLMSMTLGSALGVTATTADLMLRARAELCLGIVGDLEISSPGASPGGSPVTGLTGSLHLELEECF